MTNKGFPNRFILIFCFFLVLHSILMLNLRLFPFVDLPNHLSVASIYKHYGEETNRLDEFYSVDLSFHPNIFHPLFCSLPIFPSVEFGNKLYYLLYVILLPLSIYVTITKLKGDKWVSLLSFLFLYNFNTHWGFVGFTFSIPIFFFLIYFTLGYLERNTFARAIPVSLLFIFLYTIHIITTLFALLSFTVICFIHYRKSITAFLKGLTAVIPVCISITVWMAASKNGEILRYLGEFYGDYGFKIFFQRVGKLFYLDNSFFIHWPTGFVISKIFLVSTVMLIIIPVIVKSVEILKNRRGGERGERRGWDFSTTSLVSLSILTFLCFFFLPPKIPGNTFLFERFAVFLFLVLLLLLSKISMGKVRVFLPYIVSFFLIAHVGLYAKYFNNFNIDSQSFTEDLFPKDGKTKILGGIIVDPDFMGNPVYVHYPNYYIVWRNAPATTGIADYKYRNISRKVSKKILPPYRHWFGKKTKYDGRYNNMDYLLVRGNVPKKYLRNFEPVKSLSRWKVYKNVKIKKGEN